MNSQTNSFSFLVSPRGRRTWIAFGLWMRLFIAGLALLAGGIVLMFGNASPASAFSFMFGGGALALLAWRRGSKVLVRIDKAEAGVEASVSKDYLRTPFELAAARPVAAMRMPEAVLE